MWCLCCIYLIGLLCYFTYTDPTIVLVLTPNTTRFPNTAPYNTFSLTCTATGPPGVVSPKAFRWRRRIGADTGGLTEVADNGDSILITSTALTLPTSTSVLTVRETVAGDYRYRCRVDFNELSVDASAIDEYPITVTSEWALISMTTAYIKISQSFNFLLSLMIFPTYLALRICSGIFATSVTPVRILCSSPHHVVHIC